jgi:hypothetical protein
MAYLVVSLLVGVAQPAVAAEVVLWPTYVHLLVLGWLTQLIFGVANWMFPRQHADASAWSSRLGWAAYWCLNSGLILRALTEPGPTTAWRSDALVLSAGLQLVAGWAFVIAIWPRVRGR